jgi:phosphate transport system permease protein
VLIQGALFFSGFFSILTTIGIVYELGKEALLFFQMPEVNILGSLFLRWQPTQEVGIWPLVTAR